MPDAISEDDRRNLQADLDMINNPPKLRRLAPMHLIVNDPSTGKTWLFEGDDPPVEIW